MNNINLNSDCVLDINDNNNVTLENKISILNENAPKQIEDGIIYQTAQIAQINNNTNDIYIYYQNLKEEINNLNNIKLQLINDISILNTEKENLKAYINSFKTEYNNFQAEKEEFSKEKINFESLKDFFMSQYNEKYKSEYQQLYNQLKEKLELQYQTYFTNLKKYYEDKIKDLQNQIKNIFETGYQIDYNGVDVYSIGDNTIINQKYDNDDSKPKGLFNLNFNCYMNSLLQCLFYIKDLRNYFIENKDNFTENRPVCKALSEILYKLKYGNEECFDVNGFKQIIGEKNKLFVGINGGDAKDLYFNLIDSILNELSIEDNNTPSLIFDSNMSEKIKIFKEIEGEVDKNNIINKLFIGFYEIIYKCSSDIYNIYSFNYENCIIFNLQSIAQYYNKEKLSLNDCFEYNFNKKSNTSFYCSKCERTEINLSEEKIFRPPKILVLILDRGKGKKYKGKVDFQINIDLQNYIDRNENNYEFSTKYKLISALTHSGLSSPSGGHYTASCLTDNGKYYYFSDTYVKEITEQYLFINEPYLLFYEREDNV